MIPIPNHSDYSITEQGILFRLKGGRTPGEPIKQCLHKSKGKNTGYMYAFILSVDYMGQDNNMYTTSCYKNIAIHRLVAKTFIPNPDNKPWVNHKDGNKLNNHVSNLQWTTIKENIKHAFDTGLRSTPTGANHWLFGKKTSIATKAKMSIKKMGELHPKFKGYYIANYKRFASATQAGKHLGIPTKTIISRCNNPKFKTKGYYFISCQDKKCSTDDNQIIK